MSLCRRPIRRIALAAKTGSFLNKATARSSSQQNLPRQFEQIHFAAPHPQLVGEERIDNAIYKVYLKRVRHKTPSFGGSTTTLHTLVSDPNEQNETTGDLHNNESGTLLYSTIKVYQLKAGSLEKIVECLTNESGELDSTHMHILFSTYRIFTNTRTLIDALIARYQAVLPASLDMTEDVRQKTLKSLRMAITCLLNAYKEDFDHPPRYSTLHHLIKHVPDRELQKQGQALLDELKKVEDEHDQLENSTGATKDQSIYNEKGFDYITPWSILDIASSTIAEQLTIGDADLLKRVLPHECLTSLSNSHSRRSPSKQALTTIAKTIEYFNAVVARVIATILKEHDEQTRANVIEKWIVVAHHCRKLKNFSSLTAILNGLLSGCIYRLTTAWAFVTADCLTTLEELKNIFGSCADHKQARAILDKQLEEVRLLYPEDNEGTAKYVDVSTAINATLGKKFRNKVNREQQKPIMIGTVPYLGLYLSDLTYLDSAHPNTITIENATDSANPSEKLVNFEKHRKQFEILAQIKLFQSAANAYTSLHALPRFKVWFDNVRIYSDSESWDLSYQIEPKENTDQDSPAFSCLAHLPKVEVQLFHDHLSLESLHSATGGHSRSTNGTSESMPSSPSLTSLDKLSVASNKYIYTRSHFQTEQNIPIKSPHVHHSRSSSASSFLTSSHGSSSQGYASAAASPLSVSGNGMPNSDENEATIAKVRLAGKDDLLYKKVRIRNDERTTSVLKTILEKFGLDPSKYDRFCIEQQLPGRKILLLDHCNVFYALARSSSDEEVELIVREKTRQELEQKSNGPPTALGHNRTPSQLSLSSNHSR